jgi:hypothetical protein
VADTPGARFGVAALADDGSDAVTIYRTMLRALAAAVEAHGFVWRGQGLRSARPVAGVPGGIFKPTDTGLETVLDYDTGSVWVSSGGTPPVDGDVTVPSLRTLGGGHLQGATGDHDHGDDLAVYSLMGVF